MGYNGFQNSGRLLDSAAQNYSIFTWSRFFTIILYQQCWAYMSSGILLASQTTSN